MAVSQFLNNSILTVGDLNNMVDGINDNEGRVDTVEIDTNNNTTNITTLSNNLQGLKLLTENLIFNVPSVDYPFIDDAIEEASRYKPSKNRHITIQVAGGHTEGGIDIYNSDLSYVEVVSTGSIICSGFSMISSKLKRFKCTNFSPTEIGGNQKVYLDNSSIGYFEVDILTTATVNSSIELINYSEMRCKDSMEIVSSGTNSVYVNLSNIKIANLTANKNIIASSVSTMLCDNITKSGVDGASIAVISGSNIYARDYTGFTLNQTANIITVNGIIFA